MLSVGGKPGGSTLIFFSFPWNPPECHHHNCPLEWEKKHLLSYMLKILYLIMNINQKGWVRTLYPHELTGQFFGFIVQWTSGCIIFSLIEGMGHWWSSTCEQLCCLNIVFFCINVCVLDQTLTWLCCAFGDTSQGCITVLFSLDKWPYIFVWFNYI